VSASSVTGNGGNVGQEDGAAGFYRDKSHCVITRAERFLRSKKFMGLITMGFHELGGRSHVMVQIFGATAVREANLLFNASGSQ
jgi:hypothetical protein